MTTTWPLLPRHAMLRGHRHKHADLSPGVNIECVGEGGRVSTAHVFQCVFHGVKDPWKTQWKTCYFSVFCLKDVPTNDRRNIFVLDFLYDATSFIQSIENSHVFQWVFRCVFQATLKEYARLSMGVTMAGTRILWGEVREIGEGRGFPFNTQRAEMKLGYLRVCYRPSDNPGFVWKSTPHNGWNTS